MNKLLKRNGSIYSVNVYAFTLLFWRCMTADGQGVVYALTSMHLHCYSEDAWRQMGRVSVYSKYISTIFLRHWLDYCLPFDMKRSYLHESNLLDYCLPFDMKRSYLDESNLLDYCLPFDMKRSYLHESNFDKSLRF